MPPAPPDDLSPRHGGNKPKSAKPKPKAMTIAEAREYISNLPLDPAQEARLADLRDVLAKCARPRTAEMRARDPFREEICTAERGGKKGGRERRRAWRMDTRGGKEKGKATGKSDTVDDFEHAYATGATSPHPSQSPPPTGHARPELMSRSPSTTTTTTATTSTKNTHANTFAPDALDLSPLPLKIYMLSENLFKPIPATHALAVCATRSAAQQTLRFLAQEIGARPVHYVPEGKKRAVRTVKKLVPFRRASSKATNRQRGGDGGDQGDKDWEGGEGKEEQEQEECKEEFGFEAWIEEKNELVLKITAREEIWENVDKECVVLGLQGEKVDGEMVRGLLKSKKTDGQKVSSNRGQVG